MHEKGLPRLKQAVELIEQKGTPEEVEVTPLRPGGGTARGRGPQGGRAEGEPERATAIDEIKATIGATG